MYKKAHHVKIYGNRYLIHHWGDDGSYEQIEWTQPAYKECHSKDSTHRGLSGEYLKKVWKWKDGDIGLHFHDMTPYQHYLIERYGTDSTIATGQKELYFDIETEMFEGSISPESIREAKQKITLPFEIKIPMKLKQSKKSKMLKLEAQANIQESKDIYAKQKIKFTCHNFPKR
jgi:hypothetical protein